MEEEGQENEDREYQSFKRYKEKRESMKKFSERQKGRLFQKDDNRIIGQQTNRNVTKNEL